MKTLALVFALAGTAIVGGCAHAQTSPAQTSSVFADTLPVGFGSLKQEDIAVHMSLVGGVQVIAFPLEERIIRLLAPDSYSFARQVKQQKQAGVDSIASRARLQKYSLWYVQFYSVEPGEARFSPQEFVITNVGRDFRPIDHVLPLSSGFGDYRLKQREKKSAVYVFDGQLDIFQPLTAKMENTMSSTDWQDVLRRVEQERTLVRSRASAKASKPPGF